jgi:hypothetical protein
MSAVNLPRLPPRTPLLSDFEEEPTKPDAQRDMPLRDLVREPRENGKGGRR